VAANCAARLWRSARTRAAQSKTGEARSP
jgi:hypothetical protein